jgi:hypothetical protein
MAMIIKMVNLFSNILNECSAKRVSENSVLYAILSSLRFLDYSNTRLINGLWMAR